MCAWNVNGSEQLNFTDAQVHLIFFIIFLKCRSMLNGIKHSADMRNRLIY